MSGAHLNPAVTCALAACGRFPARRIGSHSAAFFIEALGAALLALVVLGVTDERNSARPRELAPAAIGLTITLLLSLLAPLTQAGFNPARDLMPRVWSVLAGWGAVSFKVNGWGWLTVYVLAPLIGGQVGAALYRWFFRPGYAG